MFFGLLWKYKWGLKLYPGGKWDSSRPAYSGQHKAQEIYEHLLGHQVPGGDNPHQQNNTSGDKTRPMLIIPEAVLSCAKAWHLKVGSAGLEKEEGTALCRWVDIHGSTWMCNPFTIFLSV